MLIAGFFFIWLIHIVLACHGIFADTVDHDMGMDVAGMVSAVCVGDHHRLIAWEILFCKFQTKLLCPFPSKPTFRYVRWIETDDVMVTF